MKPFSEDELKVIRQIPGFGPDMPDIPLYDFPVTPREGFLATMNRNPIWQVTNLESNVFCPLIYPDNIARAFGVEANPLPREDFGGKDMFGIDWEYVEVADGSMVRPGNPLLTDANEWQEKVVFPDIEAWDWEGSANANKEYLNSGFAYLGWIMNGYYERLIAFMDFENAAVALIDEDQQDAVKALFDELTNLYIRIVDKFIEHYHVDGFTVHDDWGLQVAPFFSPATAMKMIVPAMKKLTDHIHKRGKIADLHSCGKLEIQIPAIVAAGWDSWSPQPINDTHALYEKYGDKIILGVVPDEFPADASTATQKAAAAKFVEKFCNPDRPAIISLYGAQHITPVFREELYRLSRERFAH